MIYFMTLFMIYILRIHSRPWWCLL